MAKKANGGVRRYVDMWGLPGLHPTNIEILQQLKTADSQHFTKHMDAVGTVSEQDPETRKWEQTHLIGIRTDIWRPDDARREKSLRVMHTKRRTELKRQIKRSGRLDAKQSAELETLLLNDPVMQLKEGEAGQQRLVLKLFKTTATRVRWCGTIEQVTTSEIHNSLGSKKPLLSSVVMMPQSELVTDVQQNHRTFRLPVIFTFSFYYQRRMYHLMLRQRWFSLGVDFDILSDGKVIGKVDGRLFTCGHDSYVNIGEHPLAQSSEFLDLLTLFSASVGYHRQMRRSLKRKMRAAVNGDWHRLAIDDEELRLRQNGRAAA
jgi:hypothetical protein